MKNTSPMPATAGRQPARKFRFGAALLMLLWGQALLAQPALFNLHYDARYGSWRAESVRTLTQEEADGVFHLQSQSRILLLGRSVSTITEDASFTWQDELPLPQSYKYEQTGIGARTRSAEFDHKAGRASYRVKDKQGVVQFEGRVFDELTAFLVLRSHLQRGEKDIFFDVMDRDQIETHHYRVLSDEALHTSLGDFAAVHVARIREGDSKRSTEFWLARDHDYVLLKLQQTEPDGRSINLEISSGEVLGKPLQALQELHMDELEQDER
jgi:hypothetical protein